MKRLLLLLLVSQIASAKYVKGYEKKDGTYVEGYERTAPNNTVNDNYGTKGNTNPYTGQAGTKPQNPYESGYGGSKKNTYPND